MNLVASAILRGMVGASSSAEMSGVPGNRRARGRGDAPGSERTGGSAADSVQAAFDDGEDAREALKGTQAESGLRDNAQGRESEKWNPFRSRSGSDAVRISEAGKSAPGAAKAVRALSSAQDATKTPSTGSKLSLKI